MINAGKAYLKALHGKWDVLSILLWIIFIYWVKYIRHLFYILISVKKSLIFFQTQRPLYWNTLHPIAYIAAVVDNGVTFFFFM